MNSTVSFWQSAFLVADTVIPIVCLILVTTTLPLYVIVVIVLSIGYYQPGQNNSFYRICMVGGFIDIFAILVNYILGVLPAHGYFLNFYLSSTFVGKTYLALSWGIRYSQNCTATLLAVNRLTALVFPITFRKWWGSNRFCYFAHCLQVFTGVISGGILYSSQYYYYDNGMGGFYTLFADESFKNFYYNMSGVLATIFVSYMIVNYAIVLVHFRKMKSTVNSDLMREKQKQEHRLLYIALCILCYAFVVVAFLAKIESSTSLNLRPVRVFYLFYNASTDLYSCTPPYLLILFSTPFQRRLKQFLRLDQVITLTSAASFTRVEESRFYPNKRETRF